MEAGDGYEFIDEIKGGVIPKEYIPAVNKGIQEAMQRGIQAGYPVEDVKVTLYDGSYHDVDSSEMAFRNLLVLWHLERLLRRQTQLSLSL